jgi:hypothetical protein
METHLVPGTRPALSFHSLLGVHSAAAACCKLTGDYPLAAAIVGSTAAVLLLQAGLVAVCMRLAARP